MHRSLEGQRHDRTERARMRRVLLQMVGSVAATLRRTQEPGEGEARQK